MPTAASSRPGSLKRAGSFSCHSCASGGLTGRVGMSHSPEQGGGFIRLIRGLAQVQDNRVDTILR